MGNSMQGRNAVEAMSGLVAATPLSFQEVLDIIPAGALVVDGQGLVVASNAELQHLFGYSASTLHGQPIENLVPDGLRNGHAVMRSRLRVGGASRMMGAGQALLGQRRDGSVFPIAVGLRALQVEEASFVLAIVSDRSDQGCALASEEQGRMLSQELAHQEVLAREMGHRVKNLMAMMTALVSFSARGAQTPKDMEDSLRGRILALSSVIDLAFRAPHSFRYQNVLSIDDILRAVLAPFIWTSVERERIVLRGSGCTIGQRTAEVLALVFHELATNAVKYGALRRIDGQLAVEWHADESGLELTWQETGQQIDRAMPVSRGFGTTLIKRLVESELGGRVNRQIGEAGWTTSIAIPASALAH